MGLSESEELEMLELEEQEHLANQMPIAATPQESWGKQIARGAIDTLPAIGAVGGAVIGTGAGIPSGPGAIATGVGGSALGYAGGVELADLAKQYLLGDKPTANIAHQPLETAKRVGGNLMTGATAEMGGQVLGKGVTKMAPSIGKGAEYLGNKIDDFSLGAKRRLVGGTPTQQKAINPGVLQKLPVKMFDDAGSVATRLDDVLDQSQKGLQSSLQTMDDAGVSVSPERVLKQFDDEIFALKQKGLFRQAETLQKEKDFMAQNLDDIFLGERGLKPSTMENIKRESQANINYVADTKPSVSGKKSAASLQRQSVEDEKFRSDKQLYRDYDPIIEAAQNQAARENKKSWGRYLNPTEIGKEAWKSTVGRPSVQAWSADKIGDFVKRSPQVFGKYAQVLQSAAQRGTQGVASTHFILNSTDPEYRAILNQVADTEGKDGMAP
jgi:hypothetical protein